MIERSFFSTYALELTLLTLFLVIVNVVVVFLIRNSEILPKKKQLKIVLTAFNLLMIVALISAYVMLRPQKIVQRLAFLPTVVNGDVNRGLSFQFTEQIEHNFANQSQDNIIPHSVWWTYRALNPSEQLKIDRYVELYTKIKTTYILHSDFTGDASGGTFSVSTNGFEKSYKVPSLTRFTDISQTIVADLLEFVGEEHNRPYRNYFKADYIKAKHWLLDGKLDSLINLSETYPVNDSTILTNTLIAEAYIHRGYATSQYLDTDNPYIDDTYKKPFIEAQKRLFFYFNHDQQNFDLYPALIKYFLYQGNYQDADDFIKAGLTDFGERTTIRKTNTDALLSYSYLHLSRIRVDGFMNHFDVVKSAIEADPFNLKAYERLAHLRLKNSTLISEQVDVLFQQLKQFIELNPYNDKARFLLGDTYLKRGDIVTAQSIFKSLYNSYKNESFINFNLGITYFRIGRDFSYYQPFLGKTELTDSDMATNVAIEYFNKAIAIDQHLDSHLYLGVIYAAREEYDKAIENYRFRVKHNLGPKDRFYKEAKKGLRKIFTDEDILRKYLKEEDNLKEGY